MRRALVAPIVAVTLVLIAGAAHAATLDTRATRREIARQVGAAYQGLPFGNVACPDAVVRKSGARFMCTVQLPGTFLVFDATQSDGRGTVSFETAQAVLTKATVEAFVAGNASLAASVTCGTAAFLVLRPGQQFTCQATLADGSVRNVQLTVRDTAGNVTITGVT
jgi:hypothetical protein